MADFYSQLSDDLIDFINQQHIFFIATAPREGRINLSPKGMNTFRCLSPTRVAYLDLTGSGNETSAHIQDNQRITVMFCSFDRKPLILRLYGDGQIVHPGDPQWSELLSAFDPCPGMRQIIVIDIDSLQTSCGYAVPVMTFKEERQTLIKWTEQKSPDELIRYRLEKNARSIDGIPTRPFPD